MLTTHAIPKYTKTEKASSVPKPPSPLTSPSGAVFQNTPAFDMSKSLYMKRSHNPVRIPPKLTLYDEKICYSPQDLVKNLMQIVENAAKTSSVSLTPGQSAALLASLKLVTRPTPMPNPYPQELLTILFDRIVLAGIPLVPAFVNEIKQQCKTYVNELKEEQRDTPTTVRGFLEQWNTLNSNFDMKRGVPTDYLYQDIAHVMPLLSSDAISTTTGPLAEAARNNAANLVRSQINEPLTVKQLRQMLLALNNIYAPQQKYPYKQGFRYHSAQIGQVTNPIGTTSAMEVEGSVELVIQQIKRNLNTCETQFGEGKPLTDEMLKTVIATSAMAYQMLISIHPFADGNGRTCRMFANYILMHYHLLPTTFSTEDAKQSLYKSKSLEEERAAMENGLTAMENGLATSYNRFHSSVNPPAASSGASN